MLVSGSIWFAVSFAYWKRDGIKLKLKLIGKKWGWHETKDVSLIYHVVRQIREADACLTLFVMNFCVIVLHQLLSGLGGLPWRRVIGDKCLVWKSRDRIHYSPGNPAAVADYCDSESAREGRTRPGMRIIAQNQLRRYLKLRFASTHFSIPTKPLTFPTFFFSDGRKETKNSNVRFTCQIFVRESVDNVTHPLPRFVIQRSGHVDGSCHVFDGESAAYVTACDLVSNTRGWKRRKNTLNHHIILRRKGEAECGRVNVISSLNRWQRATESTADLGRGDK